MPTTPTANTLFYGDNLTILREHIADESVDLVYLDPPFNSNATYNVLFRSPAGEQSPAQIEAFDDTWQWTDAAERAFDEVMTSGNSDAAEMLRAMRGFLRENDMMAYLAMMAVRLLELHRVLKPTGSLYLHCDDTASHYLKLILDSIFGLTHFQNEIIWKRLTGGKSDSGRYGRNSDRILFYSKTSNFYFDPPRLADHNETTVEQWYKNEDKRGRYVSRPLTAAGGSGGDSGQAWRGRNPTGHWTVPRILQKRYEDEQGEPLNGSVRERLDILADSGYIDFSSTGLPSWRRYLDEAETPRIHDIWDDDAVKPISRTSEERIGYPTQKPVGLLERIVAASSKKGDLVLDPFCGCGATVHAAQKLDRRWIGIDITHLAVGLIKRRLHDAFPLAQFDVQGTPKDLGAAQALADADKHQFQLWALSLVEAQPFKGGRKGADGGVDGLIYFKPDGKVTEKAIVSVKGGAHVGDTMVKDLITTVEHERAKMGVFVTLAPPTKPMIARAASAGLYETEYRKFPRVQILTIAELLDGKRPEMPWLDPTVFKKAKRETAPTGQGDLGL